MVYSVSFSIVSEPPSWYEPFGEWDVFAEMSIASDNSYSDASVKDEQGVRNYDVVSNRFSFKPRYNKFFVSLDGGAYKPFDFEDIITEESLKEIFGKGFARTSSNPILNFMLKTGRI